jgi:serine O-acetyltransferase
MQMAVGGARMMGAEVREALEVLAADSAQMSNPSTAARTVLFTFRLGQALHRRRRRGILYFAWKCADLVLLRAILGAELPATVTAGPGLDLPHVARGVSIDPEVVIGTNVIIHPFTTIGRDGRSHAPQIGDSASIGTGSRVIGAVVVGARATVGANSLVLADVPAGAIAIGVPARILRGEREL